GGRVDRARRARGALPRDVRQLRLRPRAGDRRSPGRALVEDFLEPRLALPAGLAAVAVAVAAVGQPAGRPGTGAARRMERLGGARPAAAVGKGLRHAALDDLVELAAVEPDAAALRAIVDLDPLAVA